MRVAPDSIYLELMPSVLHMNVRTGTTKREPCVALHWKDGNRWRRLAFYPSAAGAGTLGAVLKELGGWVDASGGLDAALSSAREAVEA